LEDAALEWLVAAFVLAAAAAPARLVGLRQHGRWLG